MKRDTGNTSSWFRKSEWLINKRMVIKPNCLVIKPNCLDENIQADLRRMKIRVEETRLVGDKAKP